MSVPATYKAIHRALLRHRGPATDHSCRCGEPAAEWAYQFTGCPEFRNENGGRPHSLDIGDYEPMCRVCHQRFDLENDFAMAQRRKNSGGRREELVEKWQTDQEYAEKMAGVLRSNSDAIAARRKADLEFDQRMREGSRKGGKVRAERMKTDPEFAEQVTKTLRDNASVRCRCNECGMVSNRAGMGNHRRFSGHDDWAYVNEEEDR